MSRASRPRWKHVVWELIKASKRRDDYREPRMPCPPRKRCWNYVHRLTTFSTLFINFSRLRVDFRGKRSPSKRILSRKSYPLVVRPGPSLLLPREVGVEVVLITPMLRPPPPPTSSDLCFPSSALHPPSFILHPLQSSTYRVSSFLLLFVSFVLRVSLLLDPGVSPTKQRNLLRDLSTGRSERFAAKFYDWSE